jgi:hypothetical protein
MGKIRNQEDEIVLTSGARAGRITTITRLCPAPPLVVSKILEESPGGQGYWSLL